MSGQHGSGSPSPFTIFTADLANPSPTVASTPSQQPTLPGSRLGMTDSADRERCQFVRCHAFRKDLITERASHKQTQRQLTTLRANYQREVDGGIRAWEANVGDRLRRELETAGASAKNMCAKGKHALAKAKELAAERLELLEDKANLSRQVADLVAAAEKLEIESRYAARAAGREAKAATLAEAQNNLEWVNIRWQLDTDAARERREAEAEEDAVQLAKAKAKARRKIGSARRDAAAAREEAVETAAELEEAVTRKDNAEYLLFLSEKWEARAKAKHNKLVEALGGHAAPRTLERTTEEWASLSRGAAFKAHQRDQARFDNFLSVHAYQPSDLAAVLADRGLLPKVTIPTPHPTMAHRGRATVTRT